MARCRSPRAAGGAPLLAVLLVLLSGHAAVALPSEEAVARFAADAVDYAEPFARGEQGAAYGFDPQVGPLTAAGPARQWRIEGGDEPHLAPTDAYLVAVVQDGSARNVVEGRARPDGVIEPGALGAPAGLAAGLADLAADERLAAFRMDGYFAVGPERVRVLAPSHPFEAGAVLSHQELWDWHAERVGATPTRSAREQQQEGVGAAGAAHPTSTVVAVAATLLLALLAALRFTRARRSPGTAT